MMYGYGYMGMIFGMAFMLVLLVGLVLLVVWAVRRTSGGSTGSIQTGNSATQLTGREVLDQRYARGEITREQYQQMKQDLED